MRFLKTPFLSLVAVGLTCVPAVIPSSTHAQIGPDVPRTPVVWDSQGDGYDTCAHHVFFDFDANGVPESIAWTGANSDDGFLVMDRNFDGMITNGAELFGNVTPQQTPPAGIQPNGFNALATLDRRTPPINGNGDGFLDAGDAAWEKIMLWTDYNQDGISQRSGSMGDELHSLTSLGVWRISLNYFQRDGSSCNFYVGYSARLFMLPGSLRNPKVHDVFLDPPN